MFDTQSVMKILIADYPQQIWFMPCLILLVLFIVSIADARTGRVPDVPVFGMFLIALLSLAYFGGWTRAGESFLYVAASVFLLRFVNYIYFNAFNHDAFGFGDAKWTGLAVLGFGYEAAGIAWVVGAWLGLIWIGVRKVWRRVHPTYEGHNYVHFAPFLFIGLIVALFMSYRSLIS